MIKLLLRIVVSLPDVAKGEQVAQLTEYATATRAALLEQARSDHSDGIGELTVPRRIVMVRNVPLLGTGKTDCVAARQLAVAAQENAGVNAT